MADERDELGHRRSKTTTLICLVDVLGRGQRRLAVRKYLSGRRLMCDEDSDLLGMTGDEGQRVHCATAAGKQVHRSGAQG